jgi:hypothetical protein
LYLTGTASYREFFHADFDLPNVNNVGETCVTVTWLQFNAQLLRFTGEARFADQLERTVLNQLFGAQSCDGSAWGYYVQMEGKKPYSSTLDGHCCLSSGPRGVALIPTFAATTDEDGIVLNLYEKGTARLKLRDQTAVTLNTETRYPADGEVRIAVSPARKKLFTIKLRMPAWCKSAPVKVNGKPGILKTGTDGYAQLGREWNQGDRVEVNFKLEPGILVGDHKNEGKLAVLYGPLVLTADEEFLGEEIPKLNPVGVAGTNLKDLHFQPEPAQDEVRTWPGARVFRINAVARKGGAREPEPLTIKLVPFADAGRTGSVYKVWLPYGPKRSNDNLLKDGVEIRSRKPNAGSIIDDDFTTLAVTFNGKPAAQDWFGVDLSDPVTIGRIVFAHGQTFHDGGWFDASAAKPRVQYKAAPDGAWQNLCELNDYPATTATDAAGLKAGERFTCDLPKPVSITALRVIGKPACGDNPKQAFSSCAELQAFSPLR